MSELKQNKINLLLKRWPNGVVITAQDLSHHGYSYSLIHKYCLNGWLTRIGQGAYLRINDELQWYGGVYALQKSLNFPIHIGGLSALAEQGLTHYMSFKESLYLYNSTQKKVLLPRWFKKSFPLMHHYQHHLFEKKDLGLKETSIKQLPLLIASAERAILEVIALVPYVFSYEYAYRLTESLRLLRPELLQQLLESCRSIKIKRLFLHLARKTRLPCESQLDISCIDLGKGKRQIGEGGEYDSLCHLSVPSLSSSEPIIGDV